MIDGFAEGVTDQKIKAVGAMVKRGFQSVVIGVGDGALQLNAAECRAELSACSLLVERAADRRTQAEAQRWIGGICLFKYQQMM